MKNFITSPPSTSAAETPQPVNPLTPQAVIDQLRAIRSQIAAVQPLTAEQRKLVRSLAQRLNNEILQASISVIGSADLVSQAVGQEPEDVRALYDESNRWTGVEDELRTMLKGIAGANLIRRQRLALIVRRAYGVAVPAIFESMTIKTCSSSRESRWSGYPAGSRVPQPGVDPVPA